MRSETGETWSALEAEVDAAVEAAREAAEARPVSEPADVTRHVFFEGEHATRGGQPALDLPSHSELRPERRPLDGQFRDPRDQWSRHWEFWPHGGAVEFWNGGEHGGHIEFWHGNPARKYGNQV